MGLNEAFFWRAVSLLGQNARAWSALHGPDGSSGVPLGVIWGALGGHLGCPWGSPGVPLGVIWGALGGHLGCPWGSSEVPLGAIWGALGGHLGVIWGDLGVVWSGPRGHPVSR
jgi:hypothetical protein